MSSDWAENVLIHKTYKLKYPLTPASYLIMMQLHTLPLQPSGAHSAEAKTTSQELQPDGGEQGGGLEGTAGPICIPRLAALLLHARDQHHNLVECFQPQLEKQNICWSQV